MFVAPDDGPDHPVLPGVGFISFAELSLRATRPDPFQAFVDSIAAGQKLHGQVTKLVPFGVFVQVADGIEGLVHLRELTWTPVETPADALQVGDDDKSRPSTRIQPRMVRAGVGGWAQATAAIGALRAAAPALFVKIEHIGSTAVPGPAAKPVIDLMAAVHDLTHAEPHETALADLGFHPLESRPTRNHAGEYSRTQTAPLVRCGHTYAQLAAGFGVGTATAYRYVAEAIEISAAHAPDQAAAVRDGSQHPGPVEDICGPPGGQIVGILKTAFSGRPLLGRTRPPADRVHGAGSPACELRAQKVLLVSLTRRESTRFTRLSYMATLSDPLGAD